MASFWTALIPLIIAAMLNQISTTKAEDNINLGVCYGLIANNLPSAKNVVALYQKYNIVKMRLLEPNPPALEALRGSNIGVSIGVHNDDIHRLAGSREAANTWFEVNMAPYVDDIPFYYITVGNEVLPGENFKNIAPAMRALQNELDGRNLMGIKVTTVVSSAILGTSFPFPPSNGAFSYEVNNEMRAILKFLSAHKSPLMANIYPYYAYAADLGKVSLEYAQFKGTSGPVFKDGNLSYFNMFDAMLDTYYAAMEKINGSDVRIVVSETGWPSSGNGNITTPELAGTYNRNFVAHVANNKTPRRPQTRIEGFIFSMFNENLKPVGVDQHWGIFEPNMLPAYHVLDPN